ncbi:hypothetical protein ACFL5L_02920 [candidate division KSB1 bacterium]
MRYEIIFTVLGILFFSVQHVNGQTSGDQKNLIGIPFPSMSVETLSGKTVHYPDSLQGSVTLILIAFERETQEKIDTWLLPFSEKYENVVDVLFYEIPMLKRRWRLISGIIDGGMRSGIPKNRHDFVSTYYGNIDKYRTPLYMDDTSDAFVFLLDKTGVIQWHSNGVATEEKLAVLYELTENLRKMSID